MEPTAALPATGSPLPILFVNFHGTLGGGQVHLLTLLDGLDRSRFTPHIVCCEEGPFAEALRKRALHPTLISFGKGKRRYLFTAVPAMFKIHRLLKTLGIRVVHVSGLQEAKLTAYAAKWAKVPMVWVVAP
ncbi:MAG: glycosyltransferase family 4 protein [Candidatus Firestonebacteria bacterium]|nr:glycosyltransferase family 4 protein [Candidatus Firestonebacteria bacterium]